MTPDECQCRILCKMQGDFSVWLQRLIVCAYHQYCSSVKLNSALTSKDDCRHQDGSTYTCMPLLLLVESQGMFTHKLKKQLKEYYVGFLLSLLLFIVVELGHPLWKELSRERHLKESMNVRTGAKTQSLSL